MTVELTYDNYLEHYGVKGMKWGVRRSENQLASARKQRKVAKKEAKGEVKSAKKALREKEGEARKNIRDRTSVERQKRDQKHLTTLTEIAAKEDESLIMMTSAANTPIVATGREFTQHVMNGGRLDVKTTQLVYSEKSNYDNRHHRDAYDVSDAKAIASLKENHQKARENYKNVKKRR